MINSLVRKPSMYPLPSKSAISPTGLKRTRVWNALNLCHRMYQLNQSR